MRKTWTSMSLKLGLVLLMSLSWGVAVGVQQAQGEDYTVEAYSAWAGPPVKEQANLMTEPPMLSAEKQAELEYWTEHSGLPGPLVAGGGGLGAGPIPGTESSGEWRRSMETLAPETATLFRNISFPSIVAAGYRSNVMESSVASEGRYNFFTGNWFAARSTNAGSTWSYVNPFADFPSFCCDQVTIPDKARTRIFWLRMGVPDGNGENVFKLGVSANGGASWVTYTVAPKNVNANWAECWWDYPHIQLGARYMYIAWNMFNKAGSWVRTVMLRWPLDALAAGSGFAYNYYYTTLWFTFVPAQGCDHTMYWASNWPSEVPQNNRINIWKWDEDSTSITSITKWVTTWTVTGRGSAVCGTAAGNWCARYDQRLLTGARYRIMNTNLKYPGRNVIAWWWNVKQGGEFAKPYIDAAAFYEDTLAQVAGNQGRPYIWNPSICFAYPSASVNERGDLGLVFNASSGNLLYPSVAYALSDDYTWAPPGFILYYARLSNARPWDNKWGDYNTSRPYSPTSDLWTGASHFLWNATSGPRPVYFVFGRGRDQNSWTRWYWK